MSETIVPQSTVAYFSMEVGIDPAMPTYSGGLGILAGDTLRAAADKGVPVVGVTLLYHNGYFRQHLDEWGSQSESPVAWSPEEFLEPLRTRVEVTIEGRTVMVGSWRYVIRGVSGHSVPVYFLDAAMPENSTWDQVLTDRLYGGDDRYRLCQEALLGLGGIAMLRALACAELLRKLEASTSIGSVVDQLPILETSVNVQLTAQQLYIALSLTS